MRVVTALVFLTTQQSAFSLLPPLNQGVSRGKDHLRGRFDTVKAQQQQPLQRGDDDDDEEALIDDDDDDKSLSLKDDSEETMSSEGVGTDLVIVVVLVYFLQGALALARLATTYYLKDDLQLSAAEVAALQGLFVAPWVVKPIYGFTSDTIPLFGYRRKSYLALSGVVGALSFACMATFASSRVAFVTTQVVSAAAVAFADVVADSIVVERSRDDATSARLQSVSWISRYAGSISASLLSGVALDRFGAKGCWAVTAPLPLFVALAGFTVKEDPVPSSSSSSSSRDATLVAASQKKTDGGVEAVDASSNNSGGARSQFQLLWSALTSDQVFRPAIFIFLWQATPTCASAFFYFSTGAVADGGLGFDPDFVGKASAVGSVAGMAGIAAYNAFFSTARLSTVILSTACLSAIIGCTPLVLVYHLNEAYGIPDKFFALGDGVVQSALGDVGFIPILVVAAKVCPPGVEGSLFAALMSIYNLGLLTSQELGALLTSYFGVTSTNFDNLGPLVVLCSLSSLLPLLALDWVRQVEDRGDPPQSNDNTKKQALLGPKEKKDKAGSNGVATSSSTSSSESTARRRKDKRGLLD